MQGDPEILTALNEILTSELTAINQYFIHHKMLQNWHYARLSKKKREESIEEMKHADKLIERILFLDGVPNLQRLGPVKVGEEPIEMHRLDLELEREAVARLNRAIALCLSKQEAGTRELLEASAEGRRGVRRLAGGAAQAGRATSAASATSPSSCATEPRRPGAGEDPSARARLKSPSTTPSR